MAISQAARLVAIASLVACSLDASGFGHTSGSGSIGGAEASTGPVETGTGEPSSSDGTSSGVATTTTTTSGTTASSEVTGELDDGDTSSSGDEQGETTSSGGMVDPCSVAPPFELTLEADAAVLGGTMMLGALDNGQQYVYSTEADTGTATFSFQVDCPGTYAVWALVYDADPLILDAFDEGAGADRMQVDVDADNTDWRYGCQTGLLAWSWQAVGTNNGLCTNDQRKEYALAPGDHTVVFTPSEGGMHGGTTPGDTAGLMRITITNNLDFAP